MPRWVRDTIAAGLTAFLLVGAIGALEVLARSVSVGDGLDVLGAWLPSTALYGCAGLAVAVAMALVATAWRRVAGPALPLMLPLAAAIGSVFALYLAWYLRESTALTWADDHGGPLWPLLAGLAMAWPLAWALRPFERWSGGPSGRALAAAGLVALAATATWVLPGEEPADADALADADGPNLLLLSIDTLRRDRLSCLDPDAPSTPHLDRLAASGRLYTNAWSVSSWTLPSMATVMTGLPPRALGIGRSSALPPAAGTLAEAARAAGWETAAFVANPYLADEFGFARGFQTFDHTDVLGELSAARRTVLVRTIERYRVMLSDVADGRRLIARASRWLETARADRPFFLWIHMMDPHVPYRRHDESDDHPRHPLLEDDGFGDVAAVRDALPSVPGEVRRAVEDLYGGEVRYTDDCVGRLLDALEASGHDGDTWVVVLSDHGEEFFEHGGFEHGHSLMPEVTAIPLLVRPPGGSPGGIRDDRAVSLLAVAPGLGRALGWPLAVEAGDRPPLLPADGEPVETPATTILMENTLYGPPEQAILRWPDFHVGEPESGLSAWYDLSRDPGALRPVAVPPRGPALRARARDLQARWDARADDLGAAGRAGVELGARAKRRLRSLGY